MNTKRKIMNTLVAGTLLVVSGTASASLVLEWSWMGTIADWTASSDKVIAHTVADDGVAWPHPANGVALLSGDNDTMFKLDTNKSNFADNTKITLMEFEDSVTGQDYYHVNADSADGLGIIGDILAYWVSTTDPEGLNAARLGETNVGGGPSKVTKDIYDAKDINDAKGNLLLTLTSENGTAAPPVGYAGFPTQQTFYAVDTIVTGSVEHLTNEYTVPEPASLSLFGIGFLAALAARRRSNKA